MIKDAVTLELSDADLELVGGGTTIVQFNQQCSYVEVSNQHVVVENCIDHSHINIVDLVKKEVHLAVLHAKQGVHVHHCHHHR